MISAAHSDAASAQNDMQNASQGCDRVRNNSGAMQTGSTGRPGKAPLRFWVTPIKKGETPLPSLRAGALRIRPCRLRFAITRAGTRGTRLPIAAPY